ncbi:MAG: hypothetical protein CM15mP25_1850 [Gammaproteobacteria bacterium]|nr:MAG: hypothetical protein CM15mP25_1850 [Gammaproteobacteria bacterium]
MTGARLSQSILQHPVTVLRGVGDKMASRLADIGIRSLEDLLFHFPLRYQDRTKISAIGGLRDRLMPSSRQRSALLPSPWAADERWW